MMTLLENEGDIREALGPLLAQTLPVRQYLRFFPERIAGNKMSALTCDARLSQVGAASVMNDQTHVIIENYDHLWKLLARLTQRPG
jgi:hypothetical protein